MVWPRMTEIGVVRQVGRSVFSLASPRPYPKGTEPQRPHNFWDLVHVRIQYEKRQTFHVDQTRYVENFYRVDHECWRAICLRQLSFLYFYRTPVSLYWAYLWAVRSLTQKQPTKPLEAYTESQTCGMCLDPRQKLDNVRVDARPVP